VAVGASLRSKTQPAMSNPFRGRFRAGEAVLRFSMPICREELKRVLHLAQVSYFLPTRYAVLQPGECRVSRPSVPMTPQPCCQIG
jgi:hypothetical protein